LLSKTADISMMYHHLRLLYQFLTAGKKSTVDKWRNDW